MQTKPSLKKQSIAKLTNITRLINSGMKLYNDNKESDIIYSNILETNTHVLICSSELISLHARIDRSRNMADKRLYARLLAVLIIEYLKDVHYFIGKNIVKSGSPVVEPFIDDIKKNIRDFAIIKRDHEKMLYEIRNNASAHRGKDLHKVINLITTIEPKVIQKIAMNILNLNVKYIKKAGEIILALVATFK